MAIIRTCRTCLLVVALTLSPATLAHSQESGGGSPATTASPPQPPAKDSIYVHMLNVPLALVKGAAAAQIQTCKANDPEPVVVDTSVANRGDTLIVRIMDADTAASPPEDTQLLVQVGNKLQAFTHGMKSVRLSGKPREFAGQTVIVTVLGTGRPVCTGLLARPARGQDRGVPPGAQGKPREFELPRDDEAVVSIGTSFDFLDGVRAADLYADLRVFSPGLWRANAFGRRWAIGVQGGIYQGRISSAASATPDSLDRFVFTTPVEPRDTAGGLLVRRREYDRHTSRRQNNLGLYLGANVAIAPNLYWIPAQMELRKEDVRLAIRDSVVRDTSVRLRPGEPIRTTPGPVSRVFGETAYIPSFTTGLRLDMQRPGFALVLQPLFGATLRSCTFDLLPAPRTGTRRACTTRLHFVHWEISYEVEASKSGIKLGGEVRGFAVQEPEILIFLAKEFTVDKLSELISTKR